MATRGWRTEDWMAVILGFAVVVLVIGFFNTKAIDLRQLVSTYRWTTDGQLQTRIPGWIANTESIAKQAEAKGQANIAASAKSLKEALEKRDRKAIEAAAGKTQKEAAKTLLGALAGEIRGHATAVAESRIFNWANLQKVVLVGIGYLVLAAIGLALLGGKAVPFLIGFPVLFALAWLARFLAGNGLFVDWGIEYVIFALFIGLLISNTVGVPEWLKPAVQTEYFIKTGLVILGAGLLFLEILQAGALGILQAVLVIFVIWYVCFWLCRKLKVDDEFGAILSTAVSICGVSAAIAACGAIQGDKKKLSYVAALVLIVAVPMMVIMPWIAKETGMDHLVAGAWLGGTLDTSASVVAAGALISEQAMKTGVIVKFSQNALIGVAAFMLAVWWTLKTGAATGEKPSAAIIWERFPKFIIGFVLASIVFSFLLPAEVVNGTKSALGELRVWWFTLAFICVGLEGRFVELAKMGEGRPAIAFVLAQGVNILWTLLLAWLIFGGVLFSQPVIK
jgi:uncharacterized integral membrane protein (TIGR00698 family)